MRDLPGGEHGTLTFDDVKGKALERLKLNIAKVNWFSTYRVQPVGAGGGFINSSFSRR